jgi:hypothetical protein
MQIGTQTKGWNDYTVKGQWSPSWGYLFAPDAFDLLQTAFAAETNLAFVFWTSDESGNYTLRFQSDMDASAASDAAKRLASRTLPGGVTSWALSTVALAEHVVAPTAQQVGQMVIDTAKAGGDIAREGVRAAPSILMWGAVLYALYLFAG